MRIKLDGISFRFEFHENKFYAVYWADGYAYDDNRERFIKTLITKTKLSPDKIKKTVANAFNSLITPDDIGNQRLIT